MVGFRKIWVLIFFVVFCKVSFSQEKLLPFDTLSIVHFRVVNANTREPVERAYILNLTYNWGSISDLLGYSYLPIHFGDKLKISAIGYYTQELICVGQFKADSAFYEIKLKPRVYELNEVKITKFSTYERFLRGVINLNIPKTRDDKQLEVIEKYLFGVVKKMDLKNTPTMASGIAFGTDWYAKQNEKLAEQLEREKTRRVIDEKFNPGLVQKLTGLRDKELYEFIGYLDFSDEFLLQATDYEIHQKIMEKYNVFMAGKSNELKNQEK